MQIEQYPDLRAFCQTDSYQQWLRGWQAPIAHPAVDCWYDNEQDMWYWWRRHQWTPRQKYLSRVATRLPFYLLDSLQIGELPCVDIGCGDNWFQQFYPTIWGVDPHSEAHRDELLTPEWWIPNWGRWPRAFSCNAMHFCDQATIRDNILKVRGILAPGGRALVTLNRARIRDLTPDYSESALRDTLEALPGLTRMVWIDERLPGGILSGGMDGNVWLWLEAGAHTLGAE